MREVDRDTEKNVKKTSYVSALERTSTVNGIDDVGDRSAAKNKSPDDPSAGEQFI